MRNEEREISVKIRLTRILVLLRTVEDARPYEHAAGIR